MTDEIIRNGLDRKGRVNEIKTTNHIKAAESMLRVEKSRSPTRSASRSPLRSMANTQQTGGSLTAQYLNNHRQEPTFFSQSYQNKSGSTIQELCRRQL